jgi:uncharacterized membrane protein YobD (UPF0266 family)
MPGYKAHIAGALIAYVAAILVVPALIIQPWSVHAEWLMCACAGALFPDVDTKSKGQRLWYALVAFMMVVLYKRHAYVPLATLGACAFLPLLVAHRSFFHQPWFLFLLTVVSVYGLSILWPDASGRIATDAGFFFLGALTHLVLDFGPKRLVRW